MPQIRFTSHLRSHLDCPDIKCDGDSVRVVLENVFQDNPKLRGYVLDDQGRLRQHVVIFVDDKVIVDRVGLSDSVSDNSEVYVLQALSGG